MLTGCQIRAARAALNITAKELAKRAGVSLPTIQRFESVDGVPPSRSSTLLEVKAVLEVSRDDFIGSPGDRLGIGVATPWERCRPERARVAYRRTDQVLVL